MSWSAWVARALAVTVANLVTGRAALWLALPPGYVASLWPPAGISLAAVLICGPGIWPAVFLGAFLTQWSALSAPLALAFDWRLVAIAATIATGATLQALAAAWVLRRLGVSSSRLDEGHEVFQFVLFGSFAGSLVSSVVGTWALRYWDVILAGHTVRTWSTWWIGEALGTMLVGPLVIALAGPSKGAWKGRRAAVFGPVGATFAVAVGIFSLAAVAEEHAISARFQGQAASLAHRLEAVWRGYEAVVSSTTALFEAGGQVARPQFHLFAGKLLTENLGIVALQWAPRLEAPQRAALEAAESANSRLEYRVTELTADGRLVTAGPRPVTFPILFQEPSVGFEKVPGFDVASETFRRETLERAAATGRAVSSVWLRPARSPEGQDGLALVRAVFDPTVPQDPGPGPSSGTSVVRAPGTKAAASAFLSHGRHVRGFVLGVFRVPRMVGAALAAESWHGFRLSIVDEEGAPLVVYRDAVDLKQFTTTEAERAGLIYETLQTFGSRRWRLSFVATREFVRDEYTWQPYGVLTAGLAFCGLVSTFLLVLTGRTSKIEQLVDERTEELRAINDDLAREVAVRHQVEADLREARDEALAASRYKSEFLANMSHEIRTPVNAIVGLADLLGQGAHETDQAAFSQLIRTAGNDLLQIINDILDYSKIEAGKREVQAVPFDLWSSIRSIVALLSMRAAERGVKLAFEDGEPPGRPVIGDEGMLRQVLLNLVGNAVKFTEQGSVTVRVEHTPAGPGSRRFRFEVVDTGIGIAEEIQPRLFEKFFQAEGAASREHAGTGLGLSISRQLVHLMGGTIGLTSKLGQGSTFFFELTLGLGDEVRSDEAAAEQTLRAAATEQTAPPGRMLVVDDNPTNQLVVVKMLARMGFDTDVASDGSQALELVDRFCYQAVLMDCNMPVMDGYKATRAIRQRPSPSPGATPSDVCILGVTAYAMPGDREKCLEAGMDDYLAKPVTLDNLMRVTGRWLPQAAGPLPPPRPTPPALVVEDEDGLRAHLSSLVATTDADTVRRVVELFLVDLRPRLDRAEEAWRDDCLARLTTETHALAGACANLGARGLSRRCLELEGHARSGERDRAHAGLEELRPRLERLGRWLTGYLSELVRQS